VVLGGIVGAAIGHLLSCLLMGALFLWFVHGRSVPISLADMLRLGIGRSMLVGMLIFLILLPCKWLLPQGLTSTLLMVAVAGMVLVLAGLAFVVNVDERAALRSVARRLVP